LGRRHPAIDLGVGPSEWLLVLLDDFAPTAIEERSGRCRVFFSSAGSRRDALGVLCAAGYAATATDIDDEDWARRSQENLRPVAVGCITVTPPAMARHPASLPDSGNRIQIIIEPSTGFGTGHHATTRLCLKALQTLDLSGRTLVDVGTGSGILAIAGRCLGAARAIGIDCDPDAVRSAADNVGLNPRAQPVELLIGDVRGSTLPPADVVTANLTGPALIAAAAVLRRAMKPGGTMIVSGMPIAERHEVAAALAPGTLVWEDREDDWIVLALVFDR
jgi:ribosomal protein L11 methyltransferase